MLKTLFKHRQKKRSQSGFTLIEAMIAVVVFSFGLLGVAGVMIVSVKNNHNGYLRSQAVFLAHSIIETMRINSWELWRNAYNGNYGNPGSIVDLSTMCTTASPCSCDSGVATRDTQQWSNMIIQTLPNGQGSIQCVPSVAMLSPAACDLSDEPYLGMCTVTVSWDESNETNASSTQQVVVVANP